MSARDATFADARARLVPWLPEGALREHARTALAGTEQESRLVALRAVELGEAEIWSQMLTLSTATTEVLAAARDALGSLDEDACNAVTNALLEDVEKVLVPPPVLEHVEGLVVTLPTSDERYLGLQIADGGRIEVFVPTDVSIAEYAEQEKRLEVDAFVNACDELEIAAITDGEEIQPIFARPLHGQVVGLEHKTGLVAVLAAAVDEGAGDATHWARLATLEIVPRAVAEEVTVLLERVLPRLQLDAAASADLVNSEGFDCYSDLTLRIMKAVLVASPADALDGDAIARRLLKAASEAPQELLEELGPILRRLQNLLRASDYAETINSSLDDLEASDRAVVLGYVLGPVEPRQAADRAVADLRKAFGGTEESGELDVDAARAAVSGLRAVSIWSKPDVRRVLGSARYSGSAPELAADLLGVYDAADALREELKPDFLRLAGSVSAESALIAIRHAEIGAPLARDELEAVLVAAAVHASDVRVKAALPKVIDLNGRVIPKLEQFGLIAATSNARIAEDIAHEARMAGVLERRLFVVARNALRRDTATAARRLAFAEEWKDQGRPAREIASREYESLLREVSTPAQLRVVLESLLRFFPAAEQIPAIKKIRNEGLRAIERVQSSHDVDPELGDLAQRAIEQLRWNVSSKRNQVRRVLRKFGI